MALNSLDLRPQTATDSPLNSDETLRPLRLSAHIHPATQAPNLGRNPNRFLPRTLPSPRPTKNRRILGNLRPPRRSIGRQSWATRRDFATPPLEKPSPRSLRQKKRGQPVPTIPPPLQNSRRHRYAFRSSSPAGIPLPKTARRIKNRSMAPP